MGKQYKIIIIMLLWAGVAVGCSKQDSAFSNSKMAVEEAETQNSEEADSVQSEEPEEVSDEQQETQDAMAETQAAMEEALSQAAALDAAEQETTAEPYVPENKNAIQKLNSVYDCDIAADKANDNGKVDIVVGDNYYATQINDWYINFEDYEGKTVEIEGYYVGDFAPYDFVGRYGPVCPYCQGGYVSFEFLSDEDMSQYKTAQDWIKVTGILREGFDSAGGPFYYIEALKVEKMDEVGVDTVNN